MAGHRTVSCPVVASTPTDRAHFFGFHDVTPWAPHEEVLAVLRVDPLLRRLPNGSDVAQVCLWQPDTGRVDPVAHTTAWNFQIGARTQWLPDGRLLYNTVSHGRLAAEILDVGSGDRATMAGPISGVSPDGTEALAPHFGRLARYWPAYGFAGVDPPDGDDAAPTSDGLWRLDLEENRFELLLPLRDIAALGSRISTAAPQFVSHPVYNLSGTRFVFMHRFFTSDGALYSRLVVSDRDASNLVILAEEKVSHFDWLDDDTVVVWTRFLGSSITALRRSRLASAARPLAPTLRLLRARAGNAIASEGYYRISVDDGRREVIAPRILTRDGHPMFTRDGRWMLTDTYPDAETHQDLILFDMRNGTRFDVGRYSADPSTSGDVKCDLHPRWDRNARRVCIDSTTAGVRQCMVVDLSLVTRDGDGAVE